MADGEYEVETILRAKVECKPPRGKKHWLYCVKWKNYDFKDNTWEPVTSFNGGSEHFIEQFWSRVNTDGRNPDTIRDFAANEEFFPSGPPRRKKEKAKKKENAKEDKSPAPLTVEHDDSEGEVCSIIEETEEEPSVTTRGSKRRRSSFGADSAPSKRKRGRPPGIPASQLAAQSVEAEATPSLRKTRSRSNIVKDPSPSRGSPAAETSKSSPYRVPLPRKHGRNPKAPRRSSPSADDLLLAPSTTEKANRRPRRTKNEAEMTLDAMEIDEPPTDPPSPFGVPSLFGPSEESPLEPQTPAIPAHRLHTANPRVKVTDDPHLTKTSGGIATKAKLMKRAANAKGEASVSASTSAAHSARISASKAGPGRSSSGLIVGGSRLTAQKGKLTTVRPRKARPIKEDARQSTESELEVEVDVVVEPVAPQPPLPTGQELLDAAGLKPETGDLPDFEEDADGEVDLEYTERHPNGAPDNPQLKLQEGDTDTANAEQVSSVSAVVLEARPVTFARRVTAAWAQSTIFGPLTLGLNTFRSQNDKESSDLSSETRRYSFYLNLDSLVSLPVTLKDVRAKQPFLDDLDSTARNPIGTFYKDKHAINLANTLRAQESYARMTLSEGSSDVQTQHFEHFCSRLQGGELYIQMNRAQTLVICGSDNSVLGQKFGFPAQLLGLGGAAVVAHVDIENFSEYAEAAVHADTTRW